MALSNSRIAWVNRSSTTIPVYSGTQSSSIHTGGVTVNNIQIGSIAPNDFYTLVPNSSPYITCYEIRFRNSSGQRATGWIESSPGYTLGYYGWVDYQEPYHYYNSNGSTLVNSATETINGVVYRVFEITGSTLSMYNSAGSFTATLPIGARLATDSSTVGQSNPHLMYFRYRTLNGVWVNMHSSGDPWGFVDPRFDLGVSPSNRRIR